MAKSTRRKKKQIDQVSIIRFAILGTVGLIVGGLVVYMLMYLLGVVGGPAEPFQTLQGNTAETDHIEVVEYFSYECPNCQQLEPHIKRFAANLPDNVSFSRVHVSFNIAMDRLARMHMALQLGDALDKNHDRIFTEIIQNEGTFLNLESMADFFDGHGIDKTRFSNLYQGERVKLLVEQSNLDARDHLVRAVPTLVVANKYVVYPNQTNERMIGTVNDIIRKIRDGSLPIPEEETASGETEELQEVEQSN